MSLKIKRLRNILTYVASLAVLGGAFILLITVHTTAQTYPPRDPYTKESNVISPLPLPVTGAVEVSGVVEVSGTANVNVTNSPDVKITNTPIPVTGAVEISGIAQVAVTNTPDVNIANTPPVGLASNSTVQIVNAGDTPLLVQDVNDTNQEMSPADALPPGGRTIGGPGLYVGISGGSPAIVFKNLTRTTFRACITVINTGNTPVRIASQSGILADVRSGDTFTVCHQLVDTNKITLECNKGNCQAIWRVDQSP